MKIESTQQKEEKTSYSVKVVRAKEFDNSVSFDMMVNGVTIYGCWWRQYKTKDGQTGDLVSFPSQKGKDGQYYNHAFFPISKDMREEIVKQIEALL